MNIRDIANECEALFPGVKSRSREDQRETPTQDEIRAMCEKIQSEWSEQTRMSRSCRRDYSWQTPMVREGVDDE